MIHDKEFEEQIRRISHGAKAILEVVEKGHIPFMKAKRITQNDIEREAVLMFVEKYKNLTILEQADFLQMDYGNYRRLRSKWKIFGRCAPGGTKRKSSS